MEALTCSHCSAPLPPPTGNTSVCKYCGMAHFLAAPTRTERFDEDDFDEDDDDDDFGEETIAMTDAAVVELCREHFMGADSFFIAPSIPPKKERNVRALHASHLPPYEPILALYDGTVFGAADDGFLITARRLCWRNMMEPPQMMEWPYVDPDTISTEGNRIQLRAAQIQTIADEDSGFMDACEEVFGILARSARKAVRAAPQQGYPQQHGYPQQQQGYPQQQQQQGYPQQQGYGAHGPPSQQGYAVGYWPQHPPQAPQGYGPPPAQPLFGCWHCRVPLHWQSPACGRCGARPGPQGWPRIA